MKEIRCFCETITIDNIDYELICMPGDVGGTACHNFYIQPAAHDYTLREMFGLPADKLTTEEAFAVARDNAPDYIDQFC